MNFYRAFGKRLLDLVIAVPAVIVGSPLFVIVAILVRIKLGSPVIFSQRRPGRNEKPFTIYKFRSMLDEYTSDGRQLTQTERLTKFGRLIRSTSLDELPELFNVIKGEMSLVGPRPLLMEYIGYYTPEHNRRHEARPGISGWAQIKGRNTLLRSERLNLDVWYVNHMSLQLDLEIIAGTIGRVFHREGVIADPNVVDIDDVGLHPLSKIRQAAKAAEEAAAADEAARTARTTERADAQGADDKPAAEATQTADT
jgi:lipopolysaccharide/colanic/teichoic acid biosynthesis glycosyltransferase